MVEPSVVDPSVVELVETTGPSVVEPSVVEPSVVELVETTVIESLAGLPKQRRVLRLLRLLRILRIKIVTPVYMAVQRIADSRRDPAATFADVLGMLERDGLVESVAALRP